MDTLNALTYHHKKHSNIISVNVPGSLMIMGEYAALYGGSALVGAVNRYLNILLIPNPTNKVTIQSIPSRKKYTCTLTSLELCESYDLVIKIIEGFRKKMPSGFSLYITGNLPEGIGLGSSTALIVGIEALFNWWISGTIPNKKKLFQDSYQKILSWQKHASGADIAASIYGGVIHYKGASSPPQNLPNIPPLSVIYSGKKASTKHFVSKIKKDLKSKDLVYTFECWLNHVEQVIQKAIICLSRQDWKQLGDCFQLNHTLLLALGVEDKLIDDMVEQYGKNKIGFGAKVSGAGFGDCIITSGEITENEWKAYYKKYPYATLLNCKIKNTGITYKKL